MHPNPSRPADTAWACLFLAWLIALVASLGALFIGEVMNQTPCVLCWYQRAAMFPLGIVLAVAAFRADRDIWRYALPLSLSGLLIAAYHVALYYGFVSEAVTPCGAGPSCADAKMTIWGSVPLPGLSLAAFAAISLLLLQARKDPTP